MRGVARARICPLAGDDMVVHEPVYVRRRAGIWRLGGVDVFSAIDVMAEADAGWVTAGAPRR